MSSCPFSGKADGMPRGQKKIMLEVISYPWFDWWCDEISGWEVARSWIKCKRRFKYFTKPPYLQMFSNSDSLLCGDARYIQYYVHLRQAHINQHIITSWIYFLYIWNSRLSSYQSDAFIISTNILMISITWWLLPMFDGYVFYVLFILTNYTGSNVVSTDQNLSYLLLWSVIQRSLNKTYRCGGYFLTWWMCDGYPCHTDMIRYKPQFKFIVWISGVLKNNSAIWGLTIILFQHLILWYR